MKFKSYNYIITKQVMSLLQRKLCFVSVIDSGRETRSQAVHFCVQFLHLCCQLLTFFDTHLLIHDRTWMSKVKGKWSPTSL